MLSEYIFLGEWHLSIYRGGRRRTPGRVTRHEWSVLSRKAPPQCAPHTGNRRKSYWPSLEGGRYRGGLQQRNCKFWVCAVNWDMSPTTVFFLVWKYSQMRWIWQVMLAWIVDCTHQHCSYFFSHNILCWHGGCCELVCLYHFPAFQCMIVMRSILSAPGWIWNWHVNDITKYISMQKWSYLNHTHTCRAASSLHYQNNIYFNWHIIFSMDPNQ